MSYLEKFYDIKSSINSFIFLIKLSKNKEELNRYLDSYDKVYKSHEMISDKTDYKKNVLPETIKSNDNRNPGESTSDYYFTLNHLCNIGGLKKMYIPKYQNRNPNLIQYYIYHIISYSTVLYCTFLCRQDET